MCIISYKIKNHILIKLNSHSFIRIYLNFSLYLSIANSRSVNGEYLLLVYIYRIHIKYYRL